MNFEPSLNRRQLIRAAAGTVAAAAGSAFIINPVLNNRADAAVPAPSSDAPNTASPTKQPTADSAPPSAASSGKTAPRTAEGTALADAALASAGFPIPDDTEAEVRKQLGSYPGSFADARKFKLANGDAPHYGVTPALTS